MRRALFYLTRATQRAYTGPAQSLAQSRAAHERGRFLRFVLAVAVVVLWGWAAAYSEQPEASCGGDMDCQQQCLDNLQPDEDSAVCEVAL